MGAGRGGGAVERLERVLDGMRAGAAALVRHKLAGGFGYKANESATFDFACTHNFAGTLEGPRFGPGTLASLGVIEAEASGNEFLFGFTKKF